MDKVRVLMVDDNIELGRLVMEYFSHREDTEVIGVATNGAEALHILEKDVPDVLLLDVIMPQMDGYGLLDKMQTMTFERRPEVIMLTALGRDDFITRAMATGARYYMVKPFDFDVLNRRIHDVMGNRPLKESAPSITPRAVCSLEERIANMFLTVGIPAHIKGYHYLREAVKMVLDNPDVINRITKELYPGIARRFGTTASKVERAIRHAIEVAWSRGRLEAINQVFGYHVFSADDKPTNGEFVALIADKLMLERSA